MPRFHAPSDRADVYARVTGEIITAIESGTGFKWSMPWHHDGSSTARPTNVASSMPADEMADQIGITLPTHHDYATVAGLVINDPASPTGNG